MQTPTFQNTSFFSFEDQKQAALPPKEEFYSAEADRHLLALRPLWVSVSLRLILAGIICLEAPLHLTLAWLILSLTANCFIKRSYLEYASLIANNIPTFAPEIKRVVSYFHKVWYVNAILWGSSTILIEIWLSDRNKSIAYSVLTAAIYLFLTRNCANRKLMNEVSSLILGIPLIAAICRFVISDFSHEAVSEFLLLVTYVSINGFMVLLIGTRLHKNFRKTCISDYSNLRLIETLEQSEQKLRAEQAALLSANTVIQQFYSSAAHDLRQPVYAMEIYTDMLRDDPAKFETLLPKISQSCMSINHMFNNLFDFQQIHSGDMQMEQSRINIPNTYKSLALHFEPIAETKNLRISFKPLDGCINSIPLYFIRILSNLIANAITYTPSGRILVAARKSGKYVSFEVWDTGAGIEKAAQEKIFQAFYQVNANGKKTNNLGLGLAIVKDLVERLDHAKIRVNSVVGRGSVFKLLIPIENFTAAEHLKPVESSMHYDL